MKNPLKLCRHLLLPALRLALFVFSALFTLTLALPYANASGPQMTSTLVELLQQHSAQRELRPEVVARLRSHPIARLARQLNYGEGQRFVFASGLKDDWQITFTKKGEGRQSLALKKYLELLFPRAEFSVQLIPERTNQRDIFIYAHDSAEFRPPRSYFDLRALLEMSLLKAGNPGVQPPDRSYLRKLWGIEGSQRVISVYFANDTYLHKFGSEFMNALQSAYNPDYIVVSFGYRAYGNQSLFETIVRTAPSLKAYMLSWVSNSGIPNHRALTIYNDSVGLMPYVHALADLTVVAGPINFFESLNSGTRTVALLRPGQIAYDPTVLQGMVDTALRSGGFAVATSLTDLTGAIQTVQQLPAPVSPALVPDATGVTPFDRVLDALEILIRSQLVQIPDAQAPGSTAEAG